MRILRRRRGFTTNSSGANEFLPDGGRHLSHGDAGAPAPSASASPVLVGVKPWGDAPSVSPPSNNARIIGVASLVVVGAFLVVPVIRLLRKKKKPKDADADEP
jgi:hypothetical protein